MFGGSGETALPAKPTHEGSLSLLPLPRGEWFRPPFSNGEVIAKLRRGAVPLTRSARWRTTLSRVGEREMIYLPFTQGDARRTRLPWAIDVKPGWGCCRWSDPLENYAG